MHTQARPPLSVTRDDEILVRGRSLASDLMGSVGFTEMFLLDLDGEPPSPERVRVADAVLVSLMEHGITPSTLAARLVLEGAPDEVQGAVAAGLLAAGSRFLGTVQQTAELVQAVVARGPDLAAGAAAEVRARRAAGEKIPGIGHTLHDAVDPRVEVLLRVASDNGVAGPHVDALYATATAAHELLGRRLVANAAGAAGAVLSDLGYAPPIVRGFALVARCAGLVAHIADEQSAPLARAVWTDVHAKTSEETA